MIGGVELKAKDVKNKQIKIDTTKELLKRKWFVVAGLIFFLMVTTIQISPGPDFVSLFFVWLMAYGISGDRALPLERKISNYNSEQLLIRSKETIMQALVRNRYALLFPIFLFLISLDSRVHIMIKVVIVWMIVAIYTELRLYELIDKAYKGNHN
jgi:fatty acid desaturase